MSAKIRNHIFNNPFLNLVPIPTSRGADRLVRKCLRLSRMPRLFTRLLSCQIQEKRVQLHCIFFYIALKNSCNTLLAHFQLPARNTNRLRLSGRVPLTLAGYLLLVAKFHVVTHTQLTHLGKASRVCVSHLQSSPDNNFCQAVAQF